eukprot:6214638-Pleurochrysis_carterae.AAC.8
MPFLSSPPKPHPPALLARSSLPPSSPAAFGYAQLAATPPFSWLTRSQTFLLYFSPVAHRI